MVKTHDAALTPHQRAAAHPGIGKKSVITMNAQLKRLKPAALSRQVQVLTGELEALAQAKAEPRNRMVNTSFNQPVNRRQRKHLPGPIDLSQQVPVLLPCAPWTHRPAKSFRIG